MFNSIVLKCTLRGLCALYLQRDSSMWLFVPVTREMQLNGFQSDCVVVVAIKRQSDCVTEIFYLRNRKLYMDCWHSVKQIMQYSCRRWLLTIAWQTRWLTVIRLITRMTAQTLLERALMREKEREGNMREVRDTECQPEKNKQVKWERQKTD